MAYILAGDKLSVNGARAKLGLPPWQISEADQPLLEGPPPRAKHDARPGWTCPTCGHSYAPWVPECHHCPEQSAFIAKGDAV